MCILRSVCTMRGHSMLVSLSQVMNHLGFPPPFPSLLVVPKYAVGCVLWTAFCSAMPPAERNIPDAPSSQVSQSETSETFRCPSLLVYRSSPTQTRQTDHHRWTQVCDWRMLPDGFSRRQTFVFIAVSDHLPFSFFLSPSSPLPLVIISFSVFCDLLFCIPTRLSALQISFRSMGCATSTSIVVPVREQTRDTPESTGQKDDRCRREADYDPPVGTLTRSASSTSVRSIGEGSFSLSSRDGLSLTRAPPLVRSMVSTISRIRSRPWTSPPLGPNRPSMHR
jgi:hypothetical protein